MGPLKKGCFRIGRPNNVPVTLSQRYRAPFRGPLLLAVVLPAIVPLGCSCSEPEPVVEPAPPVAPTPPAEPGRVDSRPPPMHEPVDLWTTGSTSEQIDAANADIEGYVVVDLGEEWTPYIFTERGNAEEERRPNAYRATYLTLARDEFPEGRHGDRARRDKYLELYGITPTLSVLRKRMRRTSRLRCTEALDLEPLARFDSFIAYRNDDVARRQAHRFAATARRVRGFMRRQHVDDVEALDLAALTGRERDTVRDYKNERTEAEVVTAVQQRLECEGFFRDRRAPAIGALDWTTHEALAEFERRHRVYGWGFIGRGTLEALRRTPMENERQAVIRVITERVVHAAGIIEDGSMSMRGDEVRTFEGADGTRHPIPNLERALRNAVIEAFGLQTPESTLAFLDGLGQLPAGEKRLAAVRRPALPEYYAGNMELSIEIDRGDIWYDFPYDETGRELPQPLSRRPRLTVYTRYNGQRVPLARFGTTIGGWRTEFVDGTMMWKYKNSPTGARVWNQIVAAPVWLPPEGTPPRSLLRRGTRRRDPLLVNYDETGPGYASAYGLVAAYHRRHTRRANGTIHYWGDEGIRTHGSVDYMSIMRRFSHGCHRLRNHMAVRLMSFVLAHRPHHRAGQQRIAFARDIEYEDETYRMEIEEGGYVFDLEEPVPVNVLEGRIRGRVHDPIRHPIPKWDRDAGAYIQPDGGAVTVARNGTIAVVPTPVVDGGVAAPGADGRRAPDAGVPGPAPAVIDPWAPIGPPSTAPGARPPSAAAPQPAPRPTPPPNPF